MPWRRSTGLAGNMVCRESCTVSGRGNLVSRTNSRRLGKTTVPQRYPCEARRLPSQPPSRWRRGNVPMFGLLRVNLKVFQTPLGKSSPDRDSMNHSSVRQGLSMSMSRCFQSLVQSLSKTSCQEKTASCLPLFTSQESRSTNLAQHLVRKARLRQLVARKKAVDGESVMDEI